jgi:hypothetical protein
MAEATCPSCGMGKHLWTRKLREGSQKDPGRNVARAVPIEA